MIAHIRKWALLLLPLLLWACGGGGDGGNPEPEPDPVPAPSAATLIFPEDDSECTEGEIVSDLQSRVPFQWNASQNTDSYQVNLTNLETNTTIQINSNAPEVEILILRGVPYEWFVISRANGTSETATSASWRFFNAGAGVSNYAPFPAEAVSPPRGASLDQAGALTLEWSASDVDNDLAGYEVYLGESPDSLALLEATAQTQAETSVQAGTTYYWRVVCIDSQGNRTDSELFEFSVQ